MKNTDFPYINDSPLDLSGREGAPRVHDSDYCKCEMCVAADAYEKREAEKVCDDIDAVLMSLSPFAAAWASAPESMRRYTEEDIARYFFNQGWIDGHKVATVDMAEMNRLMREKGLA